jgi:hypothetical protein
MEAADESKCRIAESHAALQRRNSSTVTRSTASAQSNLGNRNGPPPLPPRLRPPIPYRRASLSTASSRGGDVPASASGPASSTPVIYSSIRRRCSDDCQRYSSRRETVGAGAEDSRSLDATGKYDDRPLGGGEERTFSNMPLTGLAAVDRRVSFSGDGTTRRLHKPNLDRRPFHVQTDAEAEPQHLRPVRVIGDRERAGGSGKWKWSNWW